MRLLTPEHTDPRIQQTAREGLVESVEAQQYLMSRGVTKQAVDQFQIGYWPSKGYSMFDGRIMFPITDLTGKIVAYQGRALFDYEAADKPKYYHGSYDKQVVIYGLYESYKRALKHNLLVVTEGPLDAIAYWIAGFGAIALLSANLSPVAALLVRMFSSRAVIALDGDTAGQAATQKIQTLLYQTGVSARVASLRGGKDPNDLLVTGGVEAIRNTVYELWTG